VGWLIDPKNHGDDWQNFGKGLGHLATHPGDLLALDTLEEKGPAYWLGGLVVGVVGAKGLGKVGVAGKLGGGAVQRSLPVIRAADGAYLQLAGRAGGTFVKTVAGDSIKITDEVRIDASRLAPNRITHILDGDESGGGHRYGVERPEKFRHDTFPADWSDEKIVEAAQRVVGDPNSTWTNSAGRPVDGTLFNENDKPRRFLVDGRYDGQPIRVVVEPAGEGIISAYPKG
jgi:hypothetical protein